MTTAPGYFPVWIVLAFVAYFLAVPTIVDAARLVGLAYRRIRRSR